MMTNPCYPNLIGPQNIPIYGVSEGGIHPNSSSSSTHPTSFLYNLSVLKDKVHQLQSLASIFLSPDQNHESTAIATSTVGTVVQEIIVTASSMMFACQQMSQNNSSFELHANHRHNSVVREEERAPSTTFFAAHHDAVEHNWYGDQGFNPCNNDSNNNNSRSNNEDGYRKELLSPVPRENERDGGGDAAATAKNYDIIELDAADLLAKYTHYCQVCGKGFKRDANLRMHMRAHGDEYKTSAALSNPVKNGGGGGVAVGRKYSCPQEGCRWNKKHTRFQPLKSMICVKNHYKRSHCPKMYVCKRCNRKQFSVLSDLRTHEKHCGDLKWQCSCGTTFSRKDKLMGHVALFVGHAPVVAAALPNGSEVVENS